MAAELAGNIGCSNSSHQNFRKTRRLMSFATDPRCELFLKQRSHQESKRFHHSAQPTETPIRPTHRLTGRPHELCHPVLLNLPAPSKTNDPAAGSQSHRHSFAAVSKTPNKMGSGKGEKKLKELLKKGWIPALEKSHHGVLMGVLSWLWRLLRMSTQRDNDSFAMVSQWAYIIYIWHMHPRNVFNKLHSTLRIVDVAMELCLTSAFEPWQHEYRTIFPWSSWKFLKVTQKSWKFFENSWNFLKLPKSSWKFLFSLVSTCKL